MEECVLGWLLKVTGYGDMVKMLHLFYLFNLDATHIQLTFRGIYFSVVTFCCTIFVTVAF